jgi:hypothetical protein
MKTIPDCAIKFDSTPALDFDKMPTGTPPRPNGNTYWVVPLKFLAGEYPGDEDPVKARKKIKQFLAAGIRHFIDLTEPDDKMVPYAAILSEEARNSGITTTHQRFPIVDTACPAIQSTWLRSSSRSMVGSGREARSTCIVGAESVEPGLWSPAGCKSTGEHRTMLWPS